MLLGICLGALLETLWALLEALGALLEALQALLEALSMPKRALRTPKRGTEHAQKALRSQRDAFHSIFSRSIFSTLCYRYILAGGPAAPLRPPCDLGGVPRLFREAGEGASATPLPFPSPHTVASLHELSRSGSADIDCVFL